MFCLLHGVCTEGVFDALGGQKRALEPMELELKMVVRCDVAVENQRWGYLQDQPVLLATKPSLQPLL